MNETPTVTAIPHREPFLFVDDIREVSSDRIVTSKYVDPRADFFRGHFPGQPVLPGVLLCECCFQAGALLMAHRAGNIEDPAAIPFLTRIQDARFKRVVQPGETVVVEVVLDDTVDNAYYLTGRATVDGELALRVKFACMVGGAQESKA